MYNKKYMFLLIILIAIIILIVYKINARNSEEYMKMKGNDIISSLEEYYRENNVYPETIDTTNGLYYYPYTTVDPISGTISMFNLVFGIGAIDCTRGGINGEIDKDWTCQMSEYN